MRKIIVTQFVSLDGVTEEPQNWSFRFWNDEIEQFKHKELFSADTLLLGRVTYDGFAAAWPTRSGEFADRINGMEKVVVSSTLDNPAWNNTRVIKTNIAEAVTQLKAASGQDVLIYGSMTLVDTLISHGLVDEHRLLVYPLLLGTGKRLFKGAHANLRLAETTSYDTSVVLLRYESAPAT